VTGKPSNPFTRTVSGGSAEPDDMILFGRTGVRLVFHRIKRGRNTIFGYAARLPDNVPPHQCHATPINSSSQLMGFQILRGKVHQVDHVPSEPTNFASITTLHPLRPCEARQALGRRHSTATLRSIRINDDNDHFGL